MERLKAKAKLVAACQQFKLDVGNKYRPADSTRERERERERATHLSHLSRLHPAE